jgi:hypothetical protein
MYQGAVTIMPNANTSKVHSQYQKVCSDDDTGWTLLWYTTLTKFYTSC